MRRMNTPPCRRAKAHGNSAERMLPRWMNPVGLGANRVRIMRCCALEGGIVTGKTAILVDCARQDGARRARDGGHQLGSGSSAKTLRSPAPQRAWIIWKYG